MPLHRSYSQINQLLANTTTTVTGCLEWSGSRNSGGYGLVRIDGKVRAPHRVVYELTHKVSLSPDTQVRHSCDNPPCINPKHLSSGTASDNMRDMVSRGRGGRAKLTPEQVADVRERHFVFGRGRNAKGNTRQLASEFGVHVDTIRMICANRTWVAA